MRLSFFLYFLFFPAVALGQTTVSSYSDRNAVNLDGINLSPLAKFSIPSILSAAGTVGHGGGVLSYLVNNQPSNTNSLDSALTGFGYLPSDTNGNSIFGIYGLSELHATTGSAVGAEFTVRNYGNAPDTNLPANQSIGTTTAATVGENLTCGGTHDCSIGLNLGIEAKSEHYFNTAIYVRNYRQYGLFIESQNADEIPIIAKTGSKNPAIHIINTGVHSPDYSVIDNQDAAGNTRFAIKQSGDFLGRSFVSNSISMPSTIICTGAGVGSSCIIETGSSDGAGTIIITAGKSAVPTGGIISVGFSHPIGAISSACMLQPAVGFLSGTTLIITSQSPRGFSFSYQNGSGRGIMLTEENEYRINYFCTGH